METRKLNKYGEFQHGNGKWYTVLKGQAQQVVTLRLRHKDIDILSSSVRLAHVADGIVRDSLTQFLHDVLAHEISQRDESKWSR